MALSSSGPICRLSGLRVYLVLSFFLSFSIQPQFPQNSTLIPPLTFLLWLSVCASKKLATSFWWLLKRSLLITDLYWQIGWCRFSTWCSSSKCSSSQQNFKQHLGHVVSGPNQSAERGHFKLPCHLYNDESKRNGHKTSRSSSSRIETNWIESEDKLQHHSNSFDHQRTWTN